MGENRTDNTHTRVSVGAAMSLDVVLPDGRRFRHEVRGDSTTIGRSRTCDLLLDDANVSRVHAGIEKAGGKFLVRDRQSVNGVIVNGTRVTETGLADGDTIVLGKTTLLVSLIGSHPAGESMATSHSVPPAASEPGAVRKRFSRPRMLLLAAGILVALAAIAGLWRLKATSETRGKTRPERSVVSSVLPAPVTSAPISEENPAASPSRASPPAQAPQPSAQEKRSLVQRRLEAGQIHFDSGRLNEAKVEWHNALRLDPENETAKFKLSKANEEIERRAAESYNRALKNFQYLNYEEAMQEWMLVMNLLPDPAHPLHGQSAKHIETTKKILKRQGNAP